VLRNTRRDAFVLVNLDFSVNHYFTSKLDILSLNEAGLVFDHIDYQETYFDVVLNNWEVELLKKISPSYEILVDDLEAEYRSRPKLTQADLEALEMEMKRKYGIQGFNFGSVGEARPGKIVATALYIYQIRAGLFNQNRKMLFMK